VGNNYGKCTWEKVYMYTKNDLTVSAAAFVGQIEAVEDVVADSVSRKTMSSVTSPVARCACLCQQSVLCYLT